MRTNLPSFALTVGMALLVVLMGFGALSAAGLVSIIPVTEEAATPVDTTALPQAWCGNADAPIEAIGDYVAASAEEKAGQALFMANCVQCHAVNEKVVGPALADITKRRSISWLVPWVQNPAKIIASGDDYAVKLYNDYGKMQMPSFGLSQKEITAIIAFVEASRGYRTVADRAPVAVN